MRLVLSSEWLWRCCVLRASRIRARRPLCGRPGSHRYPTEPAARSRPCGFRSLARRFRPYSPTGRDPDEPLAWTASRTRLGCAIVGVRTARLRPRRRSVDPPRLRRRAWSPTLARAASRTRLGCAIVGVRTTRLRPRWRHVGPPRLRRRAGRQRLPGRPCGAASAAPSSWSAALGCAVAGGLSTRLGYAVRRGLRRSPGRLADPSRLRHRRGAHRSAAPLLAAC